MRVIAGKYKRRNLKMIAGNSTRPTTDKNKENMFNLIGPYFDGGVCLDLFGGSGGLGIEAMSRGMDELYSVDSNYAAYKIIKENIETIGVENTHVYKMNCYKALDLFKEEHLKFDLVLLDPPYDKGFSNKVIEILLEYELLQQDAIVVVEEKSSVVLEDRYLDLVRYKQVNYGTTTLHIYKKGE